MGLDFHRHNPSSKLVSELGRVRCVMGTNDEVTTGANDTKRGDVNRVVCGGIDGESKGVESVMLEWNHEIFSGVPLGVFVELVLRGEPGWVPNTAHVKGKRDEEEEHSWHLPQPLACGLGIWEKREDRLGGAGTRG